MLNVNQDYYRLFYYVCRYRSLTKAANILQMSQPNMTRGLNRLEAQLGCKLLVRSTRGVTLTPEGEALYAHVAIAQEQLLAGENELEGITSLQTGSLTAYEGLDQLRQILLANGWTGVTALCTMLLCLLHFPCGTTCLTIYRETGSMKWTAVGFWLPTLMGMTMCMAVRLLSTLMM